MNQFLMLALMSLAPMTSFAADGDLTLPGEKWLAKFDRFICAAFGPAVNAPSALADLNVVFTSLTTDSTLDNGLIKATFNQDGATCSYSAIVLADNAASTMKLVQSKAFATVGTSDCAAGKAVLDTSFTANNYLYFGHPHNLSVMIPVAGAKQACGSDLVGVTFVVAGRVPATK